MTERYRIELLSNIDSDWSEWLGNFELTHTEAGHTILTGDVADQAALHGLLAKIRDLGIPILLVARQSPAEDNQVSKGEQNEKMD